MITITATECKKFVLLLFSLRCSQNPLKHEDKVVLMINGEGMIVNNKRENNHVSRRLKVPISIILMARKHHPQHSSHQFLS